MGVRDDEIGKGPDKSLLATDRKGSKLLK